MSRPTAHLLLALSVPLAVPAVHAQGGAPDLDDPEVAHVAVTANQIDVDLARLAQARAAADAVKSFAATMIRDHTAVNERAAALAARLGVTPADNDVSRSLQDGARKARATLEPLEGAAFDEAYIEREIAYHQAVLDALDTVLIPTTSNAELERLLREVRPAIAAHLEHARQVKKRLGD
jgi:putative membrane protein